MEDELRLRHRIPAGAGVIIGGNRRFQDRRLVANRESLACERPAAAGQRTSFIGPALLLRFAQAAGALFGRTIAPLAKLLFQERTFTRSVPARARLRIFRSTRRARP